jgi:hypothetical protein
VPDVNKDDIDNIEESNQDQERLCHVNEDNFRIIVSSWIVLVTVTWCALSWSKIYILFMSAPLLCILILDM